MFVATSQFFLTFVVIKITGERRLNNFLNYIFVAYYNCKYFRKEESIKVPNNIVRGMTCITGTLSSPAFQVIENNDNIEFFNKLP